MSLWASGFPLQHDVLHSHAAKKQMCNVDPTQSALFLQRRKAVGSGSMGLAAAGDCSPCSAAPAGAQQHCSRRQAAARCCAAAARADGAAAGTAGGLARAGD